jgi:hypothetical protein
MTKIRAGKPDRSRAGNARGILLAERQRVRRTLRMTPAGQRIISKVTPAEQRTELGLGDIAVEDAAAFAPVSHNHTGVYSPVSHNHTGVYSPVSHNHAGSAVSLNSEEWSGSLSGSGVKDCQGLADWIDANVGG